jgi:dolichol-phosphate mannosyltransferase
MIPTKNKVILILPAYNEENSLYELLQKIELAFNDFNINGEILLVNDGSTDNTSNIAKNFNSSYPIYIKDIIPNKGLSNAIKVGFFEAINKANDDDILIVMDADNTHTPGLILRMIHLISEGADIVIASRYQTGSRIKGLSFNRRFLSYVASLIFRLAIRIKGVKDYTCGYRAYRTSLILKAINDYKENFIQQSGFACMSEILIKLKKYDPIIVEVPLILRYDKKKSLSKMNVLVTIMQILQLILNNLFKRILKLK